jgi:hypothetical protein
MRIINLSLVFLACIYSSLSFSQQEKFSGTITFKNQNLTDTAYVTYNILNNLIRIDEADPHGKVYRSTIVDLETQSVKAIDPSKKMFTTVYPAQSGFRQPSGLEILRTGNYKYINGYQCYQWRIKDKELNTEVSYWVAESNFNFYADLVKAIPLTDNPYTFFLSIPIASNSIPMEMSERTLLRDLKSHLSVLNITEAILDPSLFEIPAGYSEFQTMR